MALDITKKVFTILHDDPMSTKRRIEPYRMIDECNRDVCFISPSQPIELRSLIENSPQLYTLAISLLQQHILLLEDNGHTQLAISKLPTVNALNQLLTEISASKLRR